MTKLALVVLFSTLLVSAGAHAACPNFCELEVSDPVVGPPLSCLVLTTDADMCSCELSFIARNRCTNTIEALDFEFDYCFHGTIVKPCTMVIHEAGKNFPLDTLGHHEWTLHLRSDQGEHTVQLSAEVTSFDNGRCFCSAPGRGGSERYPWLAVGAVGAVVWLRRRRGV